MLFKKNIPAISIKEISLKKDYSFMYENFVVCSQQTLFLLLEQKENIIYALKFYFKVYKYGYPNDEANHPLMKYGLGFYGLFEVFNSPWLTEHINNNRLHPKHNDNLYDNCKHYIAKFKDVTLEILCTKMEETELTKAQLLIFIEDEIKYIEK